MDQFEMAFTTGMDEATVEERLEAAETGVLSLADGDDSWSILATGELFELTDADAEELGPAMTCSRSG
jgi:hypothetical protein